MGCRFTFILGDIGIRRGSAFSETTGLFKFHRNQLQLIGSDFRTTENAGNYPVGTLFKKKNVPY
jgi:hypothetical protein